MNPHTRDSLVSTEMSDTANEKRAMWKGISASQKKRLMHVSAMKTTEGRPVDWEEMIGKPIPPLFTAAPKSYVESEENEKQFIENIQDLLGVAGVISILKGSDGTTSTGEILLRTLELSDEGARRLERGYWKVSCPEGPEGKTEPRGFFAHTGQSIGTAAKPKYKLKTENVIEVRWDPRIKTNEGKPCPNKTAVYEALELEEARLFVEGIEIHPDEMIDPTTGAVTEEEHQGRENGRKKRLKLKSPRYVYPHQITKIKTKGANGITIEYSF